jgi:hypothetical protein
MKLGALLTVNSLIAFAFGIGFVIAPAQVLAPYGVSLSVPGLFVARLFGASLVGYGIISWLVRNSTELVSLRALATGLAVGDVLGGAVAAWGVLSGNINALGWSTVVIYFGLAAGFGYFLMQKPAPASAAAGN